MSVSPAAPSQMLFFHSFPSEPSNSENLRCLYQALEGAQSPGTSHFLPLLGADSPTHGTPAQGVGHGTNNSVIQHGQQGHRKWPRTHVRDTHKG